MEKVVIIGASGHGRVISDILKQSSEYNLIGFIDSYKNPGSKILEYEVLGSEETLVTLFKESGISKGIIGIGDNYTRKQMALKIQGLVPDFQFINAVHPGAVISKYISLGNGICVMAGAVVNPGTKIGDHCIVNTKSSIGHDCDIMEFSSVAPGVTVGGHVYLGALSALSIGTIVRNNIRIGENTLIGAGSLVLQDFEDNIVAYGNPAKSVGRRILGDPSL